MSRSKFNWGDDIIDSRDIIARHEELNDEYEYLVEALEAAEEDLEDYNTENPDGEDPSIVDNLIMEIDCAKSALAMFNTEDKDELDLLKKVIDQGEDSPDWNYGETLIHENYFTRYTEQLVDDCYEMPKEIREGGWPWHHMNIDWEAAAEELKNDYSTIEADGETYYIRS